MRFWVYFRGTTNGTFIEAANMKTAKFLFARMNNVPVSSYICAKKGA